MAVRLTDRVLGAPPVTRVWQTMTSGRLRVLAYHGVADLKAFDSQIRWLGERFRFVSGTEVAWALHNHKRLRGALWITFDDGFASTITDGLPVLAEHDAAATLFVNPAFIEGALPWWLVCERAGLPSAIITRMKRLPDDQRRARVAAIEAELEDDDRHAVRQHMTDLGGLQQWLGAGLEVGNHTWDHPCLDTCTDDEQRRQIGQAHEWLNAHSVVGTAPLTFAFPNGDEASASRAYLRDLRYDTTLLFDHRLDDQRARSSISRLRVDADAPIPRMRAITAGPHANVMRTRDALQQRRMAYCEGPQGG